VIVQEEEERNNTEEEVLPQDLELRQDFHDTTSCRFHIEIERPKWMNNLVSL
jgi:hypothetical protein